MLLLCIETADHVCSVALGRKGTTIAAAEISTANSHATSLTLLIEQVFAEAGITAADLAAVAVSGGPGSYTGLRIGTATAKGIAFTTKIPLISVPTLQGLALGARALDAETTPETYYIAMLDARRMEVYAAIYDHTGAPLTTATPFIITQIAFDEYIMAQGLAQNSRIVLCGNGAHKARTILNNMNINYINNNCSAKYLVQIAEQKYTERAFEDLAYFEPNYLKPANITAPKSKTSENQ